MKSSAIATRLVSWLIALAFALSASAHAGVIEWTYQAEISANSTDTLGINGDTLTLVLQFDDTGVWVASLGDARLWFPATSATATIPGHTVTLNTPVPAAYYDGSDLFIAEEVASGNFMDLIIDLTSTIMSANPGSTAPSIAPTAGAHLLPGHLTTSVDIFTGFSVTGTTLDYSFLNRSITVSSIPEAPIVPLLAIGLAAIGVSRRHQLT